MDTNRLYIGNHYSIYTGYLPDIPSHQHTTGAICVSLDRAFAIKDSNSESFYLTRSAFIPQNHETEIKTSSQPMLFFCFEVESHFYQHLLARYGFSRDQLVCDLIAEDELITAARNLCTSTQYNSENTFPICQALLPELESSLDIQKMDKRIVRIIDEIEENIDVNHELEVLANLVQLSTGRITHLFREQIGISIRRYRIWKRMQNVLRLYLKGHSMTDAAIASGFNDSPHFSNSCRKLLGLTPSQLFQADKTIELYVD